MDISKIKKVYMIGIKGVGMTMLARYFAGLGIEVIGSDTAEKFMTDEYLHNAGVRVIEHFSADNIPTDADLIIYSTAYNAERNIEVKTAQENGLKIMSYAEALAKVFNYKYGIAVAGSHGKTTTSAWLGYVLKGAGLEPNCLVGSIVPQFDGPCLVSMSDYMVIEADEYQNKLGQLFPKAVLLNNIDYDHPDFFPTVDDYKNVFIDFIKKIPKKGFLVANFDDNIIKRASYAHCQGKVISYAINESADYVAYDIRAQDGKQYFKVKMNSFDDADYNGQLGDFAISLSGRHNVYNALAVIAASIELGADLHRIRRALEDFTGTMRRMQYMGTFRGAAIIDDYAHHPSEIKATLEGLRQKYKHNRLVVAFHPHTFTRTKALIDDFAQSFSLADEVIILDIYGSAREEQGGVHSLDLVNRIKELKAQGSKLKDDDIKHIPTLDEVEQYIRKTADRSDVIVLMGAGDIFRVGEKLLTP